MSRIHEALKKAEQERAATQIADGPAMATITATSIMENPDAITHSQIAPPSGTSMRFEDLRKQCAKPRWNLDLKVSVIANPSLSAAAGEQFRTLRSRLYQMRSSQEIRRLLITSSVPAEGKTFVSSNLAQAIVHQTDRRCLLIDADLRCSRLHVPLGAPSSPGLTDYLRGDANEEKVIQSGPDGNLFFIPGGSEVANPSELLLNGRLKVLLERVTPIFDWVILDSPPLLPVADASLLADHVDGVIFVVRAGSTASQAALRAHQELQGRNVIGVVLNGVQESDTYGGYYYQRYGYAQESTRAHAALSEETNVAPGVR